MKILALVNTLVAKRYVLLLMILFVLTPIIFVGNTNELFEFPKVFFVYFIAVVLAVLMVFDVLFSVGVSQAKEGIPPELPSFFGARIKKLPLGVLVFMVAFIASTLLSSHLYTSMWGYYTRFNDGLLSVLAFVVVYVALVNFTSPADREYLETLFLLTILPVGLLGIVQHYGLTSFVWVGEKVDRVYSTFGQPNWLAQYLAMLLPLVVYKTFNPVKGKFWVLVYLIGFACLWFTYSLSGVLAFFVCLLTIGSVVLVTDRIMFSRIALLLGLSVLIAIANPGIFAGRLNDLKQDIKTFISHSFFARSAYAQATNYSNGAPPVSSPNFDPTKYKVSDPGYIRAGLWQGSLALLKSSPKIFWLGTGPETFPYVFQPFRPKQLNYSSEWNFVFNKPHNYYVELAVEQGIIGLAVFALLLALTIKQSTLPRKIALLGFAVSNFFGWPVAATASVFWFWIACANATNA